MKQTLLLRKPFWQCFLLVCFALASSQIYAQQRSVTGTVKDGSTNEGLPGVSVLVKGTTTGTITDANGTYTIAVSSDSDVLVFSFVGYQRIETAVGAQSVIDVMLPVDITTLEEIVVVGYGEQKKSVVTGAIAKIGTEDLKTTKDLRIEQAMQGRTAGVIIMNNSGQPGDNLSIRIRGTGTNGNNDPLFIVDGLPLSKEGLDYLSTNDIESLEVLKDAASAAIYGTRGANGVVIITTKKGKKNERFTISYDGYYGVQNPWKKMDMLNSQQYVDIINEAAINDGTAPYFPQSMMDTLHHDTDWLDKMFYRDAPKASHSISFSGGGEKATFSSSLNYFTQDGIAAKGKSNFERITYKLSNTYDFGKVTLGSNINIANIKTKGIDANTVGGIGLIQGMNMPPIVPVKFSNGNWATPNHFNIGLQEISNPLAMLSYLNRKNTTTKVLGNIFIDVEIIKGLKFRSNYGGEVAFVKMDSYTPKYYLDGNHFTLSNSARKTIDQYNRWNWDNTLTYEKSVGKHNMSALVGFTRFKEWHENLGASRDSLIFDDFDKGYLDNSIESIYNRPENGFSEHTLQSFFGRINYNFDEKYLFEAVLRADGSSRFGAENRYGYFPAVSAGWVASSEEFFPQTDLINFAKVRASWGQNGNENIGDFKYTALMSNGLTYYYGTGQTMHNGVQPAFYPNPFLKWETSEQLNFGLDLKMLTGTVTLTVDYYEKKTKDWLMSGAPFPLLIGNVGPVVNAGSVKNSGVEIELGYQNQIREVNVDLRLTASTNKSEVLALNNASGNLVGGQGSIGQGSILRAEVGKPLGYFWGYVTEGIFQNEEELAAYPHQPNAHVGDFKFKDSDGNGTLDDEDRENIGNPYPKLILGFNSSFEWKNFDLGLFWYSALGHDIFQATRRNDLIYANYTTDILDRWYGEGTSSDMPRVTLSDPNQTWKRPSDFYLKDADFVRLKNITLGYTLPAKLVNKIGVKQFRVYVTSENLLTFSKYDGMTIEVGGGPFELGIDHGVYPESRSFIGGVNITF
ncbi:MAG TPA: TonB-dependent receptor [Ohtaekwangia sp.]|nr:TonB-dependent receptor [Ohtaekwangia sp.]